MDEDDPTAQKRAKDDWKEKYLKASRNLAVLRQQSEYLAEENQRLQDALRSVNGAYN